MITRPKAESNSVLNSVTNDDGIMSQVDRQFERFMIVVSIFTSVATIVLVGRWLIGG
jgi:hypothetical protein